MSMRWPYNWKLWRNSNLTPILLSKIVTLVESKAGG